MGKLAVDDFDLGEVLEEVVAELVASGCCASRDEVLREGVRLVKERDERLAALDASIRRGLADLEAGRTTPAEEVFEGLKRRFSDHGSVTP